MISKLMTNLKKKAATEADTYTELKKQRGMSLLEIIIVLGIIGIMAAGVVILAQRAFAAQDITDIVSNTNTVRTATVQAFSSSSAYPTAVSTVTLDANTIKTGTSTAIVSTLVKMGQLSPSEARNGISGDYYYMGGLPVTATTGAPNKGFALVITGLDQPQCRNILSQVGNQWDFVSVVNAPAGAVPALPANLAVAAAPVTTANTAAATLKSLTNPIDISATTLSNVCANTSTNGIVLGSK